MDTPFLRTRTSLQKWFYAMFLFTTTRNGVAAKELQRQLGVTYKTAWRMAKEIRIYMAIVDGDEMLGGPGRGIVEADKAFIGGKDKIGEDDKTVVLGMVERGGDVITRVIPDRTQMSVIPRSTENMMRRLARRDGRSARLQAHWPPRLPPRHREPRGEGIRARSGAHEHH